MYFLDAIQYPFKSQGWIGKAIIAALLLFIPIVNIFGGIMLSGYVLRLVREILGGSTELPDFDYGGDFMRGIVVVIAAIVYQIPTMIITAVITGALGRNGQIIAIIISIVLGIIVGLLLLVATVRYALTDDTNAFMQVGDNLAVIRDNMGAIINYVINGFLYGIVAGILVTIGFVLLVIPGLILTPMVMFGGAYMIARFAEEANLAGGKAKAKNYA